MCRLAGQELLAEAARRSGSPTVARPRAICRSLRNAHRASCVSLYDRLLHGGTPIVPHGGCHQMRLSRCSSDAYDLLNNGGGILAAAAAGGGGGGDASVASVGVSTAASGTLFKALGCGWHH